jgi:hypothetical protein
MLLIIELIGSMPLIWVLQSAGQDGAGGLLVLQQADQWAGEGLRNVDKSNFINGFALRSSACPAALKSSRQAFTLS